MISRILKLACICLMGLWYTQGYAQEICTNGIDDNADGLIDLDDPECVCFDTVRVYNFLDNPSFEYMDDCPYGFSQLELAGPWTQATDGTSDYMHPCGFIAQGVSQLGLTATEGSGFAAGGYWAWGKEYLGTPLMDPLQAGKEYTLRMDVAMVEITDSGLFCSTPSVLPPVRISVFGTAMMNWFPLLGNNGCPTEQEADGGFGGNPNWVWLGDVLYTPQGAWQNVSISIVPTQEITAIAIGPPCDLPPGYPNIANGIPPCLPYMLYDDLKFSELVYSSHTLDAPTVQVDKMVDCAGTDYLLSVEPLPKGTYYWKAPDLMAYMNDSLLVENLDQSKDGTYKVYYTIGSCTSEVAETQLVWEPGQVASVELTLPNIITPNADGLNDYLEVIGPSNSCEEPKDFELVIWNRWGNEIYRQGNGDLPFAGKNKWGVTVPTGVYFYSLHLGDEYYKQTLTVSY